MCAYDILAEADDSKPILILPVDLHQFDFAVLLVVVRHPRAEIPVCQEALRNHSDKSVKSLSMCTFFSVKQILC